MGKKKEQVCKNYRCIESFEELDYLINNGCEDFYIDCHTQDGNVVTEDIYISKTEKHISKYHTDITMQFAFDCISAYKQLSRLVYNYAECDDGDINCLWFKTNYGKFRRLFELIIEDRLLKYDKEEVMVNNPFVH